MRTTTDPGHKAGVSTGAKGGIAMRALDIKTPSEFVSLRDAMDRLFEDSIIRPFNGFGPATPFPVDLSEGKDSYVLKASLPGMKPEDITIEATAEEVTIRGETKQTGEQKDAEYLRRELRYGKVQRSFTLPLAIDPNKVEASFEHGVVTVTLPKSEVVKPKTITIKPKV
jgi:HSP20 family protein